MWIPRELIVRGTPTWHFSVDREFPTEFDVDWTFHLRRHQCRARTPVVSSGESSSALMELVADGIYWTEKERMSNAKSIVSDLRALFRNRFRAVEEYIRIWKESRHSLRHIDEHRCATLPFEGIVCRSEGLYHVCEIDWGFHWLEKETFRSIVLLWHSLKFTFCLRLGSSNQIVEKKNNNE